VNEAECLSAITQKKGELSPAQQQLIKQSGIVWGCDVCQDVCPMNKEISVTPVKEFFETARKSYEPVDTIEGRAFAWRGKRVIDRNFEIICCKE
jgi:epoxyqueuosine reductase QueG